MTEIGTVIDGKYEILKEIGRGGMSVVYLAMDKHLNKQWAVKEIRKKGNGKNDEIVVNSLIAEANLMKRLDHPSLPRIVDIIDNGITIYVVMDYIEGESLDKILNEFGAQPEELVIGWAKQLCDALSYLHSQKPSIIYRDMKPANVMLKPEGNIKIIDFGIAREYKEQNLADTTVLGTKGYAPPEQYSGQTDPRSDIFALGMTMHHLLTGVDPRNGEPYASVRQWNPELSEGIEIIIDKCVEPASENRYQSCNELLYDLEHPELITKGYKKSQKRKLASFVATISMSVFLVISGIIMSMSATAINEKDYDKHLAGKQYYKAIDIYPERIDAYDSMIEDYSYSLDDKDTKKYDSLINTINQNLDKKESEEISYLNYKLGRFLLLNYPSKQNGNFIEAKKFFDKVVSSKVDFDKKSLAECYSLACELRIQGNGKERTKSDYEDLLNNIEESIKIVDALDSSEDGEANFDKMNLYYQVILSINNKIESMSIKGIERDRIENLISDIKQRAKNTSESSEDAKVKKIQINIDKDLDIYKENIDSIYDSEEMYQQGGN